MMKVEANRLKFECHHCGGRAASKSSLLGHILSAHSKPSVQLAFRCSQCGFLALGRNDILIHYTNKHKKTLRLIEYIFNDSNCFQKWMDELEEEAPGRFFKTSTRRNNDGTRRTYLKCSEDGLLDEKGKRFCPAGLTVKVCKDGKVQVSFTYSHFGHDEDYVPPTAGRKTTADVPAQLPEKKVDVDILKIMVGLEKVEYWALQMKKKSNINVVRYHKSPGEVCDSYSLNLEDFVLVVALDEQLQVLNRYGPTFVCIDKTFNALKYDLRLVTLFTSDGSEAMLPCAYLLSTRLDGSVFAVFFSVLKTYVVETLAKEVLMTDSFEAFESWCSVMGMPKNRVYSPWNVEEEWKQLAAQYLKKEVCQKKICETLKNLMNEPDQNTFSIKYKEMIDSLKKDRSGGQAFLESFQEKFSSVERWAFWFRRKYGVNVRFGTTPTVIKELYLRGKMKKRLDESLDSMMNYAVNCIYGRESSCVPNFSTVRFGHEEATKMKNPFISQKGDDWLISSKNGGQFFMVSNKKIKSCKCALKCTECNICVHSFSCDCYDYVENKNICVHCHFLAMFIRVMDGSAGQAVSSTYDQEPKGEEVEVKSEPEDMDYEVYEPQVELSTTPHQVLLPQTSTVRMREFLRAKCEELLDFIQDEEEGQIMLKCLLPVQPTIEAKRVVAKYRPVN